MLREPAVVREPVFVKVLLTIMLEFVSRVLLLEISSASRVP